MVRIYKNLYQDKDKIDMSKFVKKWDRIPHHNFKTIIRPQYFDLFRDFIWYDIVPKDFAIANPHQYTRFAYRTDDIDFLIEQINGFHHYDDKIFSIIDQENIGIFGHSFGATTSLYSGFHNPSIKSCFSLDGWFEPMPDTLITKNISKPVFCLGQNNQGEIKYWNDLNYEKLEKIMNNNTDLSIIIDVPGSYHYDFCDFTYFTYLSKQLNFSGSVDTDTMAKLMNITLLDFFDYTLKNKGVIDLDYYKEKFPEIDIILE